MNSSWIAEGHEWAWRVLNQAQAPAAAGIRRRSTSSQERQKSPQIEMSHNAPSLTGRWDAGIVNL